MNRGFYAQLAWTGIKKNRKLYLPYIITCIAMVMMYYITAYLAHSPLINGMRGGDELQMMMAFGMVVIVVFAVIFLIYTNSFVNRHRKMEFGLYNILGMGKKNIAGILFYETLFTAGIAIVSGVVGGILFSKLGEMIVLNMLDQTPDYSFYISWKDVGNTASLFLIIFFVLMFKNLLGVKVSNPIDLLHSEKTGEKPPRVNWFLGLAGFVILGVAYYIAVTIDNPISAIPLFFLAVLLVIIATYLIFISGSVVLCRLLQKNKKYYYKTQNFISVSSMMYRMKRNGAGLASICILATMVLVMMGSTACLFIGSEDSINAQCPNDICASAYFTDPADLTQEVCDEMTGNVFRILEEQNVQNASVSSYREFSDLAVIRDGVILTDYEQMELTSGMVSDAFFMMAISRDDYLKMTRTPVTTGPDELIVFGNTEKLSKNTLTTPDGKQYMLKFVEDTSIYEADAESFLISELMFVFDNPEEFVHMFGGTNTAGEDMSCSASWRLGINAPLDDGQIERLYAAINDEVLMLTGKFDIRNSRVLTKASLKDDLYSSYAGLFFLAILLSIVFLFATVLIIYYKQITEGYEDQQRFDIMMKVGMTRKDIRKSINTQMLTVFFLPLLGAGLHMVFAFPMIKQLLVLFSLYNIPLLIKTVVASFIVFAVFYVIVYRITTNAYYSIVSTKDEE
ncbi:MAG: ABC transporter permease [Treponema sp.]|nr:ABC transporter permease [Candidatus Treponema caballi]